MKYLPIDNALFIENRKRFSSKLIKGSLAIFNSNDIMPTNADGTLPFRQNNDLFYLTGIDQEETILLIFPESSNFELREILFIRETNENLVIWEGNKLNKEEASNISGIKTIYWTSQFKNILSNLIFEAENIYLNTNEHTRADNLVRSKDDRFIEWCKSNYPLHNYKRSAPITQELRAIKSPIELDLMRNACSITERGFRRILPIIKPGIMEFEIEAELTYEFNLNRSRGHAYTPIVASGKDACILHYIKNNKSCNAGELILLDVGAEYANYASDMTRVVPVNGRFTNRQKQIYNAVLRTMRYAINLLRPGNNFSDYTQQVGAFIEEELIKLNLLSAEEVKKQNSANPLYKKYFMHGVSHFLGLDVHDVGNRNLPFQEGMVYTCEPGIYIREEGIGIRLENDILITKNGPEDLMKSIPIEVEEIEDLMNKI